MKNNKGGKNRIGKRDEKEKNQEMIGEGAYNFNLLANKLNTKIEIKKPKNEKNQLKGNGTNDDVSGSVKIVRKYNEIKEIQEMNR